MIVNDDTEDASPLFLGDEKFHTGEIILPQMARSGCGLKNCITGEIMDIDDMDSVLFGRSEDAHIRISSPAASRHHALVSRSEYGWVVEDLNSASGTLLNGEPLTEVTDLKNDDIIEICGFTVKFLDEE